MQSECFDAAFGSDDSVVISSPTGSGKTAVLELALARLFATPQTGPNRSLAVYMAPLKALTHERLLDWQPKLGGLGVSIVELTGDSADEANDERAVARADLIVTTPEKWDSFSRFRRDAQGVMGRVALLLVDEIHLLVDPSRGPTLETVISRMRTISQAHEVRGMPIASLRVLAASATISNVEDIAAWLGPRCVVRSFDDSYRPVPLHWRVLTYPMAATYSFDKLLIGHVQQVVREHAGGRPALVFCNSRKTCQQTAAHLASGGGGFGGGPALVHTAAHREHLIRAASRLADKGLASMVRSGVGFHDASLELEDRRTIEGLFLEGALPVLACTTGLAQGVNLPARERGQHAHADRPPPPPCASPHRPRPTAALHSARAARVPHRARRRDEHDEVLERGGRVRGVHAHRDDADGGAGGPAAV